MLIRRAVLDRIKSGEITRQFRRWRRPTVKAGGTLKTAVGVLAIDSVEQVSTARITAADARAAGYDDKKSLLDELGKREGDVYRISVTYSGADPRIALRANSRLSQTELTEIRDRLSRWDAASRLGPWTGKVLRAIRKHPGRRAADLADKLGYEKAWLKTNVRKLKSLGLTESLETGYALSPRGAKALERL